MTPQKHLLCGTILSLVVLLKYNEFDTAIACIGGSVLPDTDHILEYMKYCSDFSVKPTIGEFATGKYFDEKQTVYVLFHGWEFVICGILYLLFRGKKNRSRLIKGLTIGYTSHMILDQIGNNMNEKSYFWLYRWWKNWKQEEFLSNRRRM